MSEGIKILINLTNLKLNILINMILFQIIQNIQRLISF